MDCIQLAIYTYTLILVKRLKSDNWQSAIDIGHNLGNSKLVEYKIIQYDYTLVSISCVHYMPVLMGKQQCI